MKPSFSSTPGLSGHDSLVALPLRICRDPVPDCLGHCCRSVFGLSWVLQSRWCRVTSGCLQLEYLTFLMSAFIQRRESAPILFGAQCTAIFSNILNLLWILTTRRMSGCLSSPHLHSTRKCTQHIRLCSTLNLSPFLPLWSDVNHGGR